jgi:RNA polymerase sigma factor (sigma-70 family)
LPPQAAGSAQTMPGSCHRIGATWIDAIMNPLDRVESLRPRRRELRLALNLLLVGAICHLSTQIGFAFKFPPHHISPLWPTGAILFSVLVVTPVRHWWAYILAAYFSSVLTDLRAGFPIAALFFIVAGIGEVLIAALGMRRFAEGLRAFDSLRNLTAYVVVAVVLPSFASAFVAAFAGGSESYWFYWRVWFLSESLAFLVLAPPILTVIGEASTTLKHVSFGRCLEPCLIGGGLVAICVRVFNWPAAGEGGSPALVYLPLPLLLWAAVRFGPPGASTSLMIVAYLSISGAVHGRGPFVTGSPAENVLSLQLFLVVISLPLMFLATVIRERRRAFSDLAGAEQEVRREYAQLATIYHSAPVGLAFLDTQLRYVSINDQLADLNGRPADAHLGRTVREALPHLADTIEPILRRVIATGQPVVDAAAASPPGDERSWLVSHYPVQDSRGTILGVTVVVQEVAERKRAEETRRELAHASRLTLVGELTASIAHEINQPLGAILSNADAAEMLLESPSPPLDQVRAIPGDIRKDDLRAHDVIRRLRALLKKREMETQPLDLNELSSDVLLLVQAESRRRGITVEFTPADGLPIVRGDRVHLQQVLLNLVFNGMEAMADVSGEKRVTLHTTVNENDSAEIAVSDTGPGHPSGSTPASLRPLLLDEEGGHGPGAIHCPVTGRSSWGPDLGGEQARRGGDLPRRAAHESPAAGPGVVRHTEIAHRSRRMTPSTPIVHVVDDDDSFRLAVTRLLRAAGYEVRSHASAGDFLLALPVNAPGCVLLDVRMPGPSGLELQEAFARRNDALPIIFLTGHGDIPMTVRAMKAGAVDFLPKPVQQEVLLNAVRNALARDREGRRAREQDDTLRALLESLTPREYAVFTLVAAGKANKEIAAELGTSERTVKSHRAQGMAKLRVTSLAELVHIAARLWAPVY